MQSEAVVGSLSEERARAAAPTRCWRSAMTTIVDVLGLTPELADVLTGDEAVAHFFDAALAVYNNPKAIANWIANEVLRELKGKPLDHLPLAPCSWPSLVKLVDQRRHHQPPPRASSPPCWRQADGGADPQPSSAGWGWTRR